MAAMATETVVPGSAAACGAPGQLDVTVSVVSHTQGAQVLTLLQQLAALAAGPRRVVVTLNQPDASTQQQLADTAWPFELLVARNAQRLGFGANHNAVFKRDAAHGATGAFAVVNPDIQIGRDNPFAAALQVLHARPQVGLVYPQQVDAKGAPQDHQRLLPTPGRLLLRRLGRHQERPALAAPHWVNAAFIVLRPSAFAAVGGFDPAYRLYCEDVDLCLRLQLAGWQLAAAEATVVHTAARASHRNARHLLWHVQSLWRLWGSEAYAAFRRTRGGG